MRSQSCWLGQLKKRLFKNLNLCYRNKEFILREENVFLLILQFLDEASTEVLNWPFLAVLDWLTFWLWNISFNGGVKYQMGCDVINEWNFPEVASVEILEHFSEQQHSYSSGICAVRRGRGDAAMAVQLRRHSWKIERSGCCFKICLKPKTMVGRTSIFSDQT